MVTAKLASWNMVVQCYSAFRMHAAIKYEGSGTNTMVNMTALLEPWGLGWWGPENSVQAISLDTLRGGSKEFVSFSHQIQNTISETC